MALPAQKPRRTGWLTPTPIPERAFSQQLLQSRYNPTGWSGRYKPVVVNRLKPALVLPFYALHLVVAGRVWYLIDRRRFTVRAGHVLLMPPGAAVNITARSSAQTQIIGVHFHPMQLGFDPLRTLALPVTIPLRRDLPHAKALARRITVLCADRHRNLDWNRITARGLLAELLVIVFRNAFAQRRLFSDPRRAGPRWIDQALMLIERDLRQPGLSVQGLSARLMVSPRQFTRLFTRRVGVGPRKWIIHRRVERACELLITDSQVSIKEISLACGFVDPFYFSAQFKRVTGLSPTTYRRHTS